ncbi:MAG: hypothetical protein HRT93_10075 [Piscirickettsiaceae bacterium]|nr:hypothetical protein [Piscirickettsiaceae bacterium]
MTEENSNQNTTGEDNKRKGERRTGHDQREMIRFEIDKQDRRAHKDRRGSATSWGTDDPV